MDKREDVEKGEGQYKVLERFPDFRPNPRPIVPGYGRPVPISGWTPSDEDDGNRYGDNTDRADSKGFPDHNKPHESVRERALRTWLLDGVSRPGWPGYQESGLPVIGQGSEHSETPSVAVAPVTGKGKQKVDEYYGAGDVPTVQAPLPHRYPPADTHGPSWRPSDFAAGPPPESYYGSAPRLRRRSEGDLPTDFYGSVPNRYASDALDDMHANRQSRKDHEYRNLGAEEYVQRPYANGTDRRGPMFRDVNPLAIPPHQYPPVQPGTWITERDFRPGHSQNNAFGVRTSNSSMEIRAAPIEEDRSKYETKYERHYVDVDDRYPAQPSGFYSRYPKEYGTELETKRISDHGRMVTWGSTVLNYFPEPVVRVTRAIYNKIAPAKAAKKTIITPENHETLQYLLDPSHKVWIQRHGVPNLLYTKEDEKIINLATLQRINLCAQQKRISELVKEILTQKVSTDGIPYRLNKYLRKYTVAVRDYDYMKEIAAASADKKEDDPFLISTRTTFGRKLISDLDICHLPQNLPADFENPLLPGGFRNRDNITQQRQALLLRLGSAVLGGIALVGPMLLMELHKSFATSLVTVSVAVMIIGVGIALFIPDAKPRDVVVAVAGYAAVLVVFVGTSS